MTRVRPMVESDRAYVRKTLARELHRQYEGLAAKGHLNHVADSLLERATVLVAGADTIIHGFVIFRSPLVYYVYVGPAYRRQGVARQLLAATDMPEPFQTTVYVRKTSVPHVFAPLI